MAFLLFLLNILCLVIAELVSETPRLSSIQLNIFAVIILILSIFKATSLIRAKKHKEVGLPSSSLIPMLLTMLLAANLGYNFFSSSTSTATIAEKKTKAEIKKIIVSKKEAAITRTKSNNLPKRTQKKSQEIKPKKLSYTDLRPKLTPFSEHEIKHSKAQKWYSKNVDSLFQDCFDQEITRRQSVYRGRDEKQGYSFNGTAKVAIEIDSQGNVLKSKGSSGDIRSPSLVSCIEKGSNKWKLPQYYLSKPSWTFSRKLVFDVNYKYKCKDSILSSCF